MLQFNEILIFSFDINTLPQRVRMREREGKKGKYSENKIFCLPGFPIKLKL